jgi:hypothetical protein
MLLSREVGRGVACVGTARCPAASRPGSWGRVGVSADRDLITQRHIGAVVIDAVCCVWGAE